MKGIMVTMEKEMFSMSRGDKNKHEPRTRKERRRRKERENNQKVTFGVNTNQKR